MDGGTAIAPRDRLARKPFRGLAIRVMEIPSGARDPRTHVSHAAASVSVGVPCVRQNQDALLGQRPVGRSSRCGRRLLHHRTDSVSPHARPSFDVPFDERILGLVFGAALAAVVAGEARVGNTRRTGYVLI